MREIMNGYLMTCDRCGKKEFVHDHKITKWNRVMDKDICPECNRQYEELLDKFFALNT